MESTPALSPTKGFMNIGRIIIAYVSVHFILTTTQGVRDAYAQLTGEETEA